MTAGLFSHIGTESTPTWMIYRSSLEVTYEVVLMAWYTACGYDETNFLTLKSFGTKIEAEKYLIDFWDSYWRLNK